MKQNFKQMFNTDEELEAQKPELEELHKEIRAKDVRLAKIAELLVLCGARPNSSYSNFNFKTGTWGSCNLYFCYTTPAVPGTKSLSYSWDLNPLVLSNEETLQLTLESIDTFFDFKIEDYSDAGIDHRCYIAENRILDAVKNGVIKNDLNPDKDLLNNDMPKAKDATWIAEVYGEANNNLQEEFGITKQEDENYAVLSFRKFDYERKSLMEILIGKIVDAERVKAEGFIPNSTSNSFADLAHQYLLEDIAKIQEQAKQQLGIEKGE